MTQEIVAAAVVARDDARDATAHAMETAVFKDGEAGGGFVVEGAAAYQLKPTLVANDSGFVELTGLPERFQCGRHELGAHLEDSIGEAVRARRSRSPE